MTNTLLPPRPPAPVPAPKTIARRVGAATLAPRRRRSPPACRQQPRDLDPRRRKTSPTWKISILNFTQAQRATPRCRHRTAAHGPSQSSQSMGPRPAARTAQPFHRPRRRCSWDGAGRSYPVSHSSKQVRCSTLLLHFLLSTQCCPHYMHSGQRLSIMLLKVS